jgi:hypothetical protein
MKQIVFFLLAIIVCQISFGEDTLLIKSDTITHEVIISKNIIDTATSTSKHKTLLKRYPPYIDSASNKWILRNQNAQMGQKILRGSGSILISQALSVCLLLALPEKTSNWDKSRFSKFKENYKEAFTKPPVVDTDKWYINYIGHPYQGSLYYNAYRSQGAKFWQASLFALAHSTTWEYLIESGFERPSIQDLVVTPCVGSLLGELFHFSTLKMSKNGFRWYEAMFVSIFNPMYAINNGFKQHKK